MNQPMNSDVALAANKPIPLDVPSESLFILERDGFTQTNYGGFSFCGPCDAAAFDRALQEAQADFPTFHANLVPYRRGLWTAWGWQIRPQPAALEVHDLTSLAEAPADMEAWVHAEMAPRTEHLRDLRILYPVQFFLYLFPGQRQMFVFLYNHAAVDGGGFYNFFATTLRIYHRLVTGQEPEWAGVAGMHNQAGALELVTPIPFRQMLRESIAEGRKYPPWRVAQFASTPAAPTGRKIVRHIIEEPGLQKALRDRARRDGGSLTDLFIAASKKALEEFNSKRGADCEIMMHGLPVNQRLRRPREETKGQGNPMGAIGISSNSADRRDPEALLRWVIAERKRKLAAGYDYWLPWIGRQFIVASRVLPIGIRARVLRPLFDIKSSFVVTNLGVVLPRMENGRPTGETAIREVGRMELVDVHNNTAQSEKNAGALILRTFLGRLYLVFTFGRYKIADDDAETYARLVVDHAHRYL